MAEAEDSIVAETASRKRHLLPLSPRSAIAGLVAMVVILIVVGLLFLRKNGPPRAARLLPEADAIVYLDATPVRAAIQLQSHPVKHDADYQKFIDATGIEFERDLSEVAFGLHRMANPLGPNGPVAFSTVFIGNFDHQRLLSYLASIAQSQEHYAGEDIYNVAVEGRTDRVAILDARTVAVSNTPTAEQIHSILDRRRTAALPFSGDTLLAQHYKDVPLFSLAWGIGKLAAGLDTDDLKLFGFRIPLSVDATFISSVRFAGTLRLRIEEIAPNSTAAALSADSVEALLGVARTAENMLPNAIANPDAKVLLDSVEIEHHNDRTVLNATIPVALLQKLTVTPDEKTTAP